MKQGVHRRALGRAVKAATWLDPDTDAAAIRAAADLADIIDQLRDHRQNTLLGMVLDSKEAWHAASCHQKFLNALESLRLTPSTRPAQATEDAADLVTQLRAVVTGDGAAAG